jgi:hypothetical protein
LVAEAAKLHIQKKAFAAKVAILFCKRFLLYGVEGLYKKVQNYNFEFACKMGN